MIVACLRCTEMDSKAKIFCIFLDGGSRVQLNCSFRIIDGNDAIVVTSLTNQLTIGNDAGAAARPRGLKLEWPRIDMGVESETWNALERCWDNFYHDSEIDAATASVLVKHSVMHSLRLIPSLQCDQSMRLWNPWPSSLCEAHSRQHAVDLHYYAECLNLQQFWHWCGLGM